jgi:zinc transport system substrate-binding protein
MVMKLKSVLILIASSFLVFTSCQKKIVVGVKPQILVSIPAYKDLVQELVGHDAEVISVVPEGFNAHYFEVKPNDLGQIKNPIAWFGIQEGFEPKLLSALNPRYPDLRYYNLMDEIDFSAIAADHDHDHGDHQHKDTIDNHIWMSPELMKKQMRFIKETLQDDIPHVKIAIDEIEAKLNDLDKTLHLDTALFQKQALLVSHGSFGYFCQDYHLVQIPIEVDGKQPLPKDMEHLLQHLKETKVICVLAQNQFDSKAAEYLAKLLNKPLYRIDPYSSEYFKMLYSLGNEIKGSS